MSLLTSIQNRKIPAAGFTVIELMVTITIVVLVTGIIMIQYGSFNNSVLLTSQAYETAFDLREAQSLAIGVKRGNNANFREEFGIHFDLASPNQYILFQDSGAGVPARYGAGEEIGTPYIVDPRFVISDICTTNTAGTRSCSAANISVTFQRPDFDAVFGPNINLGTVQSVEIIYATAGNLSNTRTVTISSTGQISVD